MAEMREAAKTLNNYMYYRYLKKNIIRREMNGEKKTKNRTSHNFYRYRIQYMK